MTTVLLYLLTTTLIPSQRTSHELVVKVHNFKHNKGSLKYALYDEKDVFLKKAYTFGDVVIQDHYAEFKITGLEEGIYAISIFHDENDNGELDANWVGIPTEPYAFSNNAKGRFGPPSFEDCHFELSQTTQLTIEL